MINYNEKDKIFNIKTKNTSYLFGVDKFDVLNHYYYGAKIKSDDITRHIFLRHMGFSGNIYEAVNFNIHSLDTLPQEFPTYGVGDYRISPVHIINSDLSMALDLRYDGFKIKDGKYKLKGLPTSFNHQKTQTLEVYLIDKVTNLKITLLYSVFYDHDVITRSAIITNQGNKGVILTKALSFSLDIPFYDFNLKHFYGRHNMERVEENVKVLNSITKISSNRGTTSHQHNPGFILSEPNTTEKAGDCFGFNLVYSGNFLVEIEKDQQGMHRVLMGIDDKYFDYELKENESFYTPEVIFTFSNKGFGILSNNFHKFINNHIIRNKSDKKIVINNWEATYFDFNEEKLVGIAKEAKKLGIELFVLDDGWFGNRDNDDKSLGDYHVNLNKLPNGLKGLATKINKIGLEFGLWVEPEMISEDSDLYLKNPNWAIKIPNRLPNISRNQLVLDLTNVEVRDYIYNNLADLLDNVNINYLKWDMNRNLSDLYSLNTKKAGEFSHKYVLGLYELLEKVTNNYPNLMIEGCSGGGGRFDLGMLYYFPHIWTSDNTDAYDRLLIQKGTSYMYPQSTISCHVSSVPNHQTQRLTTLNTRGVVASAGVFGYELDINKLTNEEKMEVSNQIKFYKKHQDLIIKGNYYRLTTNKESIYAWVIIKDDESEFLLYIVDKDVHGTPPPFNVKIPFFNKDLKYIINDTYYYTDELKFSGISFNGFLNKEDSKVLYGKALI